MKAIKNGAVIHGLQPEILRAWDMVDEVYVSYGFELCVLTSGTDGKHGAQSFHPYGLAIDLRTWDFPGDTALSARVVAAIKTKLGDTYDVVLESDHLHIEYQPK